MWGAGSLAKSLRFGIASSPFVSAASLVGRSSLARARGTESGT